MFEDFAKKKFNDYHSFIEFSDGKTTFQKIRNSNLPPYIINFFDCSSKTGIAFIEKNDFDEILNRAIVFNINYVIKPRSTLLKFLFGDVETRPAESIKDKLRFFQFYSYYINTITEFININTPLIVSIEQIEHLIDEVNNKILSEISDTVSGDTQRLNLIKLLYYFFLDLTKNNPINIKLPKKILSLFFGDKGFTEIKDRIDRFFSEEIFIQEAVELMKPAAKKTFKTKLPDIPEEKIVDDFLIKAKNKSIDPNSSEKDIEQAINPPAKKETITEFRPAKESDVINRLVEDKQFIKEELQPEELLFNIKQEEKPAESLTEEQKQSFLVKELFCEESYRKKIIKRVFNRNEKSFNDIVLKLLGISDWKNAAIVIEEYFDKNKIDYFTEEAVKFVDVIQTYFSDPDKYASKKQGNLYS